MSAPTTRDQDASETMRQREDKERVGHKTPTWVYCRACRYFRPYRTVGPLGRGYCAANPRRHDLRDDQKRQCTDYAGRTPV